MVCYIFITAMLSKAGDSAQGHKYGAVATAFFFVYYIFFGVCWQVSLCETPGVSGSDVTYSRVFRGYTQARSIVWGCELRDRPLERPQTGALEH